MTQEKDTSPQFWKLMEEINKIENTTIRLNIVMALADYITSRQFPKQHSIT